MRKADLHGTDVCEWDKQQCLQQVESMPTLFDVNHEIHILVKYIFDVVIHLIICPENQISVALLNERQSFHSHLAIQ